MLRETIFNYGCDTTDILREIRLASAYLSGKLPPEEEIKCLVYRGRVYIDLAIKEKKIYDILKIDNPYENGKIQQYIDKALDDFIEAALKFLTEDLKNMYDWIKGQVKEGIKLLLSSFAGALLKLIKSKIEEGIEKIRSLKASLIDVRGISIEEAMTTG